MSVASGPDERAPAVRRATARLRRDIFVLPAPSPVAVLLHLQRDLQQTRLSESVRHPMANWALPRSATDFWIWGIVRAHSRTNQKRSRAGWRMPHRSRVR